MRGRGAVPAAGGVRRVARGPWGVIGLLALAWTGRSALLAADPDGEPPVHAVDPADDDLIALAAVERAVPVSSDLHLTVLSDRFPVRTPAAFLASPET